MGRLTVLDNNSSLEDEQIDTCATCPKLCRSACPVAEAEARETTTPWNLVNFGGYVKNGLATLEDYGDLPYHCSHCGACTDACLHDNDVPGLLSKGRQRLLSNGLAPASVREIRDHFGVAGNPYGNSLKTALEEMAETLGFSTQSVEGEGSYLYQPGCASIYEHSSSVSAFLRVTHRLGIDDINIDTRSSHCCGLPLLWSGDVEGFREHASRHSARLSQSSGVVVQDPACAHAMTHRYAELGVKIKADVMHISQFLRAKLADKPLSVKHARTDSFAYAECCSMKYGLKTGEGPLKLIQELTGLEAVSLPNLSGNDSDCCGAGGLLPTTSPATAEDMASAKLLAFRESGAEQLVTFSPRCAAHMKSIAPHVKIVDAMELLASR